MPLNFRKIAKCPSCLPDAAGAIFRRQMGNEGWEWKCSNCHHIMPIRKITPSKEITKCQAEIIEKIKALGWAVETKMIGRAVWIQGKKDRGSFGMNLIAWDSIFGTISVKGTYKITLQRLGEPKIVTDSIGLSVWLS